MKELTTLEKLQEVESYMKEQEKHIKRLEAQNKALRSVVRDPDRFPPRSREQKHS